ncbi:hypothetical protein NEA10_20285 [Phormidium yuhuli AB48]|uniref:FlgD Ig-like domain-containing protein n=1 Tax=Phormidium yuhuli AB48 TaxID=2940671 RepID=A0ABY5AQT3_9CYAN|nr:hypothetical protein [Phormidium yuhuli]USR91131.1 hypothetical protein NEA10_20285 [Phormidium yuhuli AB48]
MKPNQALIIGFVLAATWMTPVHACPSQVSDRLIYQRRPNPNRCEGINRQGVSGSFGLVSFATSTLTHYPTRLRLQVPKPQATTGSNPSLRVRSFGRRYQLDNLALQSGRNNYEINLGTDILQGANVPAQSLRAIAHFQGSQPVYSPVIIGSSGSYYELVFYSPSRAVIHSLEIHRNNQVVHRDRRPNPRDGEIRFTWDARNQPEGLYRLQVQAEIQRRGQRPEQITRIFALYHHPDWLSP